MEARKHDNQVQYAKRTANVKQWKNYKYNKVYLQRLLPINFVALQILN
jgi:hypothetical protein